MGRKVTLCGAAGWIAHPSQPPSKRRSQGLWGIGPKHTYEPSTDWSRFPVIPLIIGIWHLKIQCSTQQQKSGFMG